MLAACHPISQLRCLLRAISRTLTQPVSLLERSQGKKEIKPKLLGGQGTIARWFLFFLLRLLRFAVALPLHAAYAERLAGTLGCTVCQPCTLSSAGCDGPFCVDEHTHRRQNTHMTLLTATARSLAVSQFTRCARPPVVKFQQNCAGSFPKLCRSVFVAVRTLSCVRACGVLPLGSNGTHTQGDSHDVM